MTVFLANPLAFDQKRIKSISECQQITSPVVVNMSHDSLGERLAQMRYCNQEEKYVVGSKGPDDLESLR
jgi:hypothetical protein